MWDQAEADVGGQAVSERPRPRRGASRRALIGLGVIALIGVGLFGAFRVLSPAKDSDTVAYAARIGAHGGYVHINVGTEYAASCGCLSRYYIGPANADPAAVFTGPDLSLRPASVTNDLLWDWLLDGDGNSPSTGHCTVSVQRLPHDSRRDYTLDVFSDIWHLSPQQLSGLNQRELDILMIEMGCDSDADA